MIYLYISCIGIVRMQDVCMVLVRLVNNTLFRANGMLPICSGYSLILHYAQKYSSQLTFRKLF